MVFESPNGKSTKYEALVIGVSAGGMKALPAVLASLPADLPLAVAVVQHVSPVSDQTFYVHFLSTHTQLRVQEACERETLLPGTVYIAPANYHLLVERNRTFSLSIDERVNHCRPSIDVLFESAAEAYQDALIGIILTGANSDGAAGLRRIKAMGGLAIVQDPTTADSSFMPTAAIEACAVDFIVPLEEIPHVILKMLSMNQSLTPYNQGGD